MEEEIETIVKQLVEATSEQLAAWEQWVVSCHALKGEARGLGASKLGEEFYRLELAGKEKKALTIQNYYPITVKEWEKVVDGIHTLRQGKSL